MDGRFSSSPLVVDPTPALPERFRQPADFAWGAFTTQEGRTLRWGHLAAAMPRAQCVLVGGFTEFVEKYFETIGDLVASGLSVWCLDWYGQGGSQRPAVLPNRPRARDFERDARDLASFAGAVLPGGSKRILIAHSMGGAIALLCLRSHPELFDAAVLSAPMLGLATGAIPVTAARFIAGTARLSGLGSLFVPGARQWHSTARRSPALSRTSNDPERCRIHQAWFEACPDLIVEGPTYGWLDAAFRITERIRRAEFLASIGTPILIGSAGIEAFVDRQAHRDAAASLPACTLIELSRSKHEPFLEIDAVRDRWLAAIGGFLAQRIGSR